MQTLERVYDGSCSTETQQESMKEIIEQRMAQLGYTQYKLTQEICKLRAQDGVVPPVSKYQSSIRLAIAQPEQVKTQIVLDIIKALGGEVVIRWNNPQEVKL